MYIILIVTGFCSRKAATLRWWYKFSFFTYILYCSYYPSPILNLYISFLSFSELCCALNPHSHFPGAASHLCIPFIFSYFSVGLKNIGLSSHTSFILFIYIRSFLPIRSTPHYWLIDSATKQDVCKLVPTTSLIIANRNHTFFHCLTPYMDDPLNVQNFSWLFQSRSWLAHLVFDVTHHKV